MMKKFVLGVSLVCGAAGMVSALPRSEPIAATEMHGGGSWKARRRDHGPQRWHLQINRGSDGWVRGRIRIEGSPFVTDGIVEGRIAGDTIVGTIADDNGSQVATFQGTVTQKGMFGTYTAVDGEVGEWSWAGKPPSP